MKIYYQQDVNTSALHGKTVAIFGYGSQGAAQAKNMRDSGVQVMLGLREGGPSWGHAQDEGFSVYSFAQAAAKADIIHFLVPDERHGEIFEQIKANVTAGKTLSCSHGFNFHFGVITPPEGVDVIMIAPKAPGPTVRREYENGYGVPALIAVFKDASGNARQIALAMAHANGHTKPGVIETTFKDETETDLFGEQAVLCGGLAELMRSGFDTLVKNGYQPEIAYFECIHEVKLIVDMIYQHGISGMYKTVSNTAKYGGLTIGPKIVTNETRKVMQEALDRIKNGEFAKEWLEGEYRTNRLSNLKRMIHDTENWQVEKVGKGMRKLAGIEK